MNERKMATVRRIDAIDPIPDADAIEVATVGGWKVVVKKGEYKVGSLAIYCEIDSFLPTEVAPFLSKDKEPRIYEGVKGERLRTVRLRKQISQGLLLPHDLVWDKNMFDFNRFIEGDDVSDYLNIKKYEPPIDATLSGEARGNFPSRIPKTNQERIQNLSAELHEWTDKEYTWEVSEKLEGSSMTIYLIDGDFGVCSRNLDLKRNNDNSFWKMANKLQLEEKLMSLGKNIAIQGEIVGPGIQGDIYKLKGHHFYVYDIYDITAGRYYTPIERKEFVTEWDILHVPVLKSDATLGTMAEILVSADGKSLLGDINGPNREGLVYKCNECDASFKVISNQYLLKAKD